MAAPPQTRYVHADGLHIAYQVVGDGPMDVLYVAEVRSPMSRASVADGSSRSATARLQASTAPRA